MSHINTPVIFTTQKSSCKAALKAPIDESMISVRALCSFKELWIRLLSVVGPNAWEHTVIVSKWKTNFSKDMHDQTAAE